jgi:cytochrome c oxidase subunit 3
VTRERLSEGYADLPTQERAVRFGMWVFLASETMLFAGLFGLYAGYRLQYGAEFVRASHHNNELIGSINTFVLIVSSFFVAWAIRSFDRGQRRTALASLIAVIALGATFLGLKTIEYSEHLAEGIAPGAHYTFAEMPGWGARTFYSLYYLMTGLHALHVIAGMTLMVWLCLRIHRKRMHPHYHPELELSGLYWHLVDIIWIFLWPLLYLA